MGRSSDTQSSADLFMLRNFYGLYTSPGDCVGDLETTGSEKSTIACLMDIHGDRLAFARLLFSPLRRHVRREHALMGPDESLRLYDCFRDRGGQSASAPAALGVACSGLSHLGALCGRFRD